MPSLFESYGIADEPAAAPTKDPNAPGQFRSGLNRAFSEVPGLAAGSAAYVADVAGANETRDRLLKYAKESGDASQAAHVGDAASITDAWDGKTNWADFIKNASGYVAGQAIQGIASGGLGALSGKMLATQGVKAVAERVASESIAKGASQEVATQAAADAAKSYVSQMATRGAVVGAGGQNLNMELGSIYPDAVDEATKQGRTLDSGDKFRVGASALGAAAVDTAAEAITANRVFRGSNVGAGMAKPPTVFGNELLGRAVREVPMGMVREAGTEGVQTAIEHYGAGVPIADEKGRRDIIDSMGVGAVGGMWGGAGASMRARHDPQAVIPKVPDVGPLSRAANAGIDAAGPPPTPPPTLQPVAPAVATDLLAHANTRAQELADKEKGSKAIDTTPEVAKQFLTPAEKDEQTFLNEHGGDAQALAHAYPGLAQDTPANEAGPTPQAATVADMANPIPANVNPKTGEVASPIAQREQDRPAEPAGQVQDGDILNGQGKPFTTMPGARTAQKKAGDTHELVRVAGGLVVRKKAGDGTTDGIQPATVEPAATGGADTTASVAPGSVAGDPAQAGQGGIAAADLGQPGEHSAGTDAGTVAQGGNVASQTIDAAAHDAATSPKNELVQPTDGQKEAGNYQKGHVSINGLDLSIENPAGSTRSGTDRDGKAWENTLQHHYGYIKGTIGNDKDHVDAFVKPGTPLDHSGPVYVVDQNHPDTGKFDEHKALIGFDSIEEAKAAYHANYAKDWKGLKAISTMPFDEFKSWAKDGPKTEPLVKITDSAKAPSTGNVATPATETGHFAAGEHAFKAGEPRVLPSYYTVKVGKNPKDWYRGWDKANADATVTAPVSEKAPQVEDKPATEAAPPTEPSAEEKKALITAQVELRKRIAVMKSLMECMA